MGTAAQPAGRSRNTTPRGRTESELLSEISAKLDRVVAVLAAQGKSRDMQIDILTAAGCDSSFIGTVVGMTGGAVRKYQSRRRRTGQTAGESDTAPEATTS